MGPFPRLEGRRWDPSLRSHWYLEVYLLATSYFLLWDFLAAHRFLHEIQLNCGVNKMSVDNLATVIGVNLIRSKVEDPAVIMRGTAGPVGKAGAEEVTAIT